MAYGLKACSCHPLRQRNRGSVSIKEFNGMLNLLLHDFLFRFCLNASYLSSHILWLKISQKKKKEKGCVAFKWNFWIYGSFGQKIISFNYIFKSPKSTQFGSIFYLFFLKTGEKTPKLKKISAFPTLILFFNFIFSRWVGCWRQHNNFFLGLIALLPFIFFKMHQYISECSAK